MPYIVNNFELPISAVTSESYTVTGITAKDSVDSYTNGCREGAVLFGGAIHQTLLDSGYDAIFDEVNLKITVLGFSFFVKAHNASNSLYGSCSICGALSNGYSNVCPKLVASSGTTLKFTLILRGDNNGFIISAIGCANYGSYTVDDENIVIGVFKTINLITNEPTWISFRAYGGKYVSLSSDIYAPISESEHKEERLVYSACTDQNIEGQYLYSPVFSYYGTVYVPSAIVYCSKLLTDNSFYKIGDEIFFAMYKTNHWFCIRVT